MVAMAVVVLAFGAVYQLVTIRRLSKQAKAQRPRAVCLSPSPEKNRVFFPIILSVGTRPSIRSLNAHLRLNIEV